MQLSAQRRARIIHAQLLHHQGNSLRQIAEQLHVSHSTVHDDLQHFDDHYPDLARSLAQTLAVNHALSLNAFLEQLLAHGPLGPANDLGDQTDDAPPIPPDRLQDIHRQYRSTVVALFREQRLALRELRQSARPPMPPLNLDLLPLTAPEALPATAPPQLPRLSPQQLLNLAGGLQTPDQTEQDLTEPTDSEHPQPPRPDTNPQPNPAAAPIPETAPEHQPAAPQNRAQRRRAQRQAQRQTQRQARKQRQAV